ncbi:probable membrane protein [Ramularia collo-cygni]|uniref:Probable membrane protein n=1 Tax=Ramularia collo-cygni TaxID=112498 RepID=A0A2D3V0S3_9PEZI|nr:probable membrane protein [Ramularia collo-cygni]CZT19080.1 probable membrane protein [Ramularia collo-cygni]
MSGDRLFRLQFPRPEWLNSATTRSAGIYLSGALFSIALFILIDSAVYSNSRLNGADLHMNFVDWIPGICSFVGMIIINSIDKSRLTGDSFAYSGDGVAWKARVILFLGFAAMAGGLAGGTCVMVLKYVIKGASGMTLWFGTSNLVANALVMLSSVVLWISQNMEDDYAYNLAL